MKVEEAKTKVCPFISDVYVNENNEIKTLVVNCIGDKCMAWENYGKVSYEETKNTLHGFIKSWYKDVPTGHCARIGQ